MLGEGDFLACQEGVPIKWLEGIPLLGWPLWLLLPGSELVEALCSDITRKLTPQLQGEHGGDRISLQREIEFRAKSILGCW